MRITYSVCKEYMELSSLLRNIEHFTPYFLRIVKARILERHHTSFFFVDYKVKIRNDLLYAVHYWRDSQSNVPDDITVEQMIEVMMGYLHNLEETLMTFDDKRVNTSNVNNLMFTAYSRFPSLHRKAQRLSLKEVELWRKALYNSQKAGTIRRDFDRDQVALMFSHIKNTYDNGLGRTQMDFSLLEKSYREFHKIIKNY